MELWLSIHKGTIDDEVVVVGEVVVGEDVAVVEDVVDEVAVAGEVAVGEDAGVVEDVADVVEVEGAAEVTHNKRRPPINNLVSFGKLANYWSEILV